MSKISSILRPVATGVAAAALGTLAMDASIYRRYRYDGGTVQAHIPLAALSPILRPEYGVT